MKNALIGSVRVQFLEMEWQEELSKYQLAERFHCWLHEQDFMQKRLPDLLDADFCQLSIDPS